MLDSFLYGKYIKLSVKLNVTKAVKKLYGKSKLNLLLFYFTYNKEKFLLQSTSKLVL